jgi:hypothetical protein
MLTLEEQEMIANRMNQLLSFQPGSLIVGQQSGNENAREYSLMVDANWKKHFRHHPETWKELGD